MPIEVYTYSGRLVGFCESRREVGDRFGIDRSRISDILNGKISFSKGYTLKSIMARTKKEKKESEEKPQLPDYKVDRLTKIQEKVLNPGAIEIVSAKLRGGMFLNYAYSHNLGSDIKNKANIESDLPVHDDLKARLKMLSQHVAVIVESLELSIPIDSDLDLFPASIQDIFNKFQCLGVTVESKVEKEGVVLHGVKYLKYGELGLKVPEIKYKSKKYDHTVDLQIAVWDLIDEVHLYIGGKRAIDVQPELGFDSSGVVLPEGQPLPSGEVEDLSDETFEHRIMPEGSDFRPVLETENAEYSPHLNGLDNDPE